MVQGSKWVGVGLILGIGTFTAIGQPALSGKQVDEATFLKIGWFGDIIENRRGIPRIPDKEFMEPYPTSLLQARGSFPVIEGNLTSSPFEAILVQDMSFGDFRIRTGEGGISLSPSGAIQTMGSIDILDRRMRPAVFQITTDSLRFLEVWLPEVFYLQSEGGAPPLAVRPVTAHGSGRFLMELQPRPAVNMLRIGGELTILSVANKVQPGEFSAAFQIVFIPLY